MSDEPLSPATRLVALGRQDRLPGSGVNAPLEFSSTYIADGPVNYARAGNPTWSAFEEALGALEGGEALVFASGMAAVAAAVSLVPHGGTVVVPAHAYNGTTALLDELEQAGAVRVRRLYAGDDGAAADVLDGAAMLWIESPTNPMLEVFDLPALCAAARERGVLTVCDNTFATPLVQQPLESGADVVLHSVTKYLAGHSDVILGALVTPPTDAGRDLRERLGRHRLLHGAIAGPMETWLALRGMRTLHLRVERATARPRGARRPARGAPRGRPRALPRVRRDRLHRGGGGRGGGRAGGRGDPAVDPRDQPRRRGVAGRAAPAPPGRARHGARGAAAALGRHRGRRGPLARPRPGPARLAHGGDRRRAG